MQPVKSLLIFSCMTLFAAQIVFPQTVTVTKSVYPPGEKIVVNYSGFPGNEKDWISIAQPGSAADPYLHWGYLYRHNVGATNAYLPFSTIVGIHQQVLRAVALTECCCYCN